MATFSNLGGEFRVNTTLVGSQFDSSVAGLAGGGFVVIFNSNDPGGPTVLGQIFDANGVAVGAELVIASVAGNFTRQAVVTGFGTGFAAAYSAPNPPLFHPDSVWTETFDAAGAGAGEVELDIGSNTNHHPRIAASTLGGLFTVWQDNVAGSAEILGKTGTGGVFTVNTTTAGLQIGPSVAALQDGSGAYVVAWTQASDLKGQFIAADGSKIGGEFTIDTAVTGSSDQDMEIAGRPGAGFAIAYTDSFLTHVKVHGAGNAALGDFIVQSVPPAGADQAVIAVLSNGLIAVAERDFGTGNFSRVGVFAPDGTRIGGSISLQAGSGSGIINDPAIAALANGRFVVTWTDNRATLGDADHAVTAQRFTTASPSVIDGTTANDTFDGAALTRCFVGYGGTDVVSYAGAGAAVTVNLGDVGLNGGAAAGDAYGSSVERIAGSNFADKLTGDGAVNRLEGGNGDDILAGAGGGDALIGGSGSDTASYAGATARVKVALDGSIVFEGDALGDTFSSIARLTGTGSSDVLIGDLNGNVINGGSSNDTIRGQAGNDLIYGDKGGDNISGNAGDDRFSYLALDHGGDTINDFGNATGNNDIFNFKGSAFGALPVGALAANRFAANLTGAATTADHRFIYETDTGILRFDANGTGAGGVTVIATLTGAPVLAVSDFDVI